MTPISLVDTLFALGSLAGALGVLAVNRRVRRLEDRVTRIARARGHYGPPPEAG